jgi:H+-transporting ATPase
MKANLDPAAASNSTHGSETKAKGTMSAALQLERASGLKSAGNEPQHAGTPTSIPATTTPAVSDGLTSDEARRRLAKSGPNAMPDTSVHPLRMALEKFWAPFHGCSKRPSCSSWCSANMLRP